MNIELKPIQSTNIAAIGGIKVYQYQDVPASIYEGFSENSAGVHFAKNIRGKFDHVIIEPKQEPEKV